MKFLIIFSLVAAGTIAGFMTPQLLHQKEAEEPAPLLNLTTDVTLDELPIPMVRSGKKLGHCLVQVEATLPLGYPDNLYFDTMSELTDMLIKTVSNVPIDVDPAAFCAVENISLKENLRLLSIKYYPSAGV